MKKKVDLYPRHTETVRDFMIYLDSDFEDEPIDLNNRIYTMLGELLSLWSTKNKTQLWKDVKVMNLVNYIFLLGVDEASGIAIEVGICPDGLFFNMNIAHPENFLKMKDDFWLEWLELIKFGDFELEESEVFPSDQMRKYPKVFRNKKSSILLLMRNIIVYPMLNDGYEIDFGRIMITWPPSKYTFNEVVELGSEAFGRMWKLNQRLTKKK